jgi:hypothetical protein
LDHQAACARFSRAALNGVLSATRFGRDGGVTFGSIAIVHPAAPVGGA